MPLTQVCKAEDVLARILKLSVLLPFSYSFKVISITNKYPLSQGKTIQPVNDSGINHLAGDPLHAALCAGSCEQVATSLGS